MRPQNRSCSSNLYNSTRCWSSFPRLQKRSNREESQSLMSSKQDIVFCMLDRLVVCILQMNKPTSQEESERLFLSFVASNLHQMHNRDMRDKTSLLNTHNYVHADFIWIYAYWTQMMSLNCGNSNRSHLCVCFCISFKCIFVNFYFCNSYFLIFSTILNYISYVHNVIYIVIL